MQRTCEAGCGRHLDGRPDKRYCSEACSKRARRGGAVVTPMSRPKADENPDAGTAAAVRRELEAAGRTETYLGQSALALAERVDSATAVMGFAALVKELRSTMEAATAGVRIAADPVDELRSRRDSKRAG